MAYNFHRTSYGVFDELLLEIMYGYALKRNTVLGNMFLDLTLVDEENSVLIYTSLQKIQFIVEMNQKEMRPWKIGLRIETTLIVFERQEGKGVACMVETQKQNQKKTFYPSIITVF